jgi:hypothetical protein
MDLSIRTGSHSPVNLNIGFPSNCSGCSGSVAELFEFQQVITSSASSGNPLKTFTGQISPLQQLSCNSEEVEVGLQISGDTMTVTSEGPTSTYTCTGSIFDGAGADLSCTVNQPAPEGAGAKFELHANPDGSARFAFSNNQSGFVSGKCTAGQKN